MKRTHLLVMLGSLLALVACSSRATKEEPQPPHTAQETPKSDVSPTEEMLVREVLRVMLEELYPVEKHEPVKSLLGDAYTHTTTVYIYDQKHYDAAKKIVQRFTRGAEAHQSSLVLSNGTERPIVLRVGTPWWPIEVPLGVGEYRRFNGAGAQFLDEIEVEIAEGKTDK